MDNTIDRLAGHLDTIADLEPKTNLDKAFGGLVEGMDHDSARLYLLGLLQDAIDLAVRIPMQDSKRTEVIIFFKQLQARFLKCCGLPTANEFYNNFTKGNALAQLRAYSMVIDLAGLEHPETIDRDELVASTKRLAKDLTQSNLPDYVRKALDLKLYAFSRVVEECNHFSDDQIRRRVKIIFADYCSEVELHDKTYQATSEKMKDWAKKSAKGGSETLQVTSAVVGLLQHLT